MSPKGVGERPDQDLGPPMETDVSVRVPCAAAIHPSRGLRGPLCRLKPRSLTRRGSTADSQPLLLRPHSGVCVLGR